MPSPLRTPGLDPTWAHLIVDSHSKGLADECAICFSEINNSFRPKEAITREEEVHDEIDMEDSFCDPNSECDHICKMLDTEENTAMERALSLHEDVTVEPDIQQRPGRSVIPVIDIMKSGVSEAEVCPCDAHGSTGMDTSSMLSSVYHMNSKYSRSCVLQQCLGAICLARECHVMMVCTNTRHFGSRIRYYTKRLWISCDTIQSFVCLYGCLLAIQYLWYYLVTVKVELVRPSADRVLHAVSG